MEYRFFFGAKQGKEPADNVLVNTVSVALCLSEGSKLLYFMYNKSNDNFCLWTQKRNSIVKC